MPKMWHLKTGATARRRLGSGMALLVLLAQMMIRQMGVYLRRGDTGMAQQFLNVAQGCAILE